MDGGGGGSICTSFTNENLSLVAIAFYSPSEFCAYEQIQRSHLEI